MDLQALLSVLAGLSSLLSSATLSPTMPAAVASAPSAVTAPAPAGTLNAPSLPLSLANLRDSIVNIICLSDDPSVHSSSGSGVIIDSRGLILTVSHVAQYFLLQDREPSKVRCVIRTGNPARTMYFAEPVYISKPWLVANPTTLTDDVARGTGEDDIAVLAITDTATSTPLPKTFPFVPLAPANTDPLTGQNVAIGAYAAQDLTTAQISRFLYQSLVFGSVQSRYTFDTDTVDMISLGGSVAAQEGSSGGGVTNDRGQLIGTITTSTIEGDLLSRDLHALTISHIRRSFYADTGLDLDQYLSGNSISDLIASFRKEDASLGRMLVNDIRRAK